MILALPVQGKNAIQKNYLHWRATGCRRFNQEICLNVSGCLNAISLV
ncbi:MAG: hypothetical protein IJV56_07335 [Neisseriaceae bacterium]|nr:hypothetical protein [Neisseriaceae bacterium]